MLDQGSQLMPKFPINLPASRSALSCSLKLQLATNGAPMRVIITAPAPAWVGHGQHWFAAAKLVLAV